MKRLVILDSGPTGLAAKASGKPVADAFHAWIKAVKTSKTVLAIPEIARYEVRRELFRVGAIGGLRRLDHLHPGLAFLPLTSEIMDVASELWAIIRQAGLPTASDDGIDGDAIVAATATVAAQVFEDVIVATDNVQHLNRFPGVDAREWWTMV